jgi:hypothetical protein
MEGEMWVDCKQERRLPLIVISHSDRAGDKGSHFRRGWAGASDPVESAPVGGDAVGTLQQFLN